MRYSQLRAFHQVALHGGFSRAAAALNQTQPALSDQVRKLEQAHDTLLFRREARQVVLTEAGEGLLRLTREFFETEDRIAAYLGRSSAALSGQLRIIADSATHIATAVRRFRKAHPRVSVVIRAGNTETVLRALRNYDAEIGVVGNIADAPDLEAVDLGHTPIVAIAARGFLPESPAGLRFADLARHSLIFRETGSRTRAELEAEAERRGVRLAPVIEVEGREAMREMVAAGAGLGFVSEAEAGQDSRIVQVPIVDVDLSMAETLVTLTARRELRVIRAFLGAQAGKDGV